MLLNDSREKVLLGFRMSEDVRFEIGGLSKLLITPIEGTDVGSVARMDTNVRP